MRRAALLLALLAALLAGCSGGQPKLPRLAPDAVVLAFGDCLTAGVGANPGESYPARLEALIGRKVLSSGVPGETSAGGLARLPAALEEAKPQLVILCEGGNDFLQKLDEAQAANNIRAMVRLARAQGAQVVGLDFSAPMLANLLAERLADTNGLTLAANRARGFAIDDAADRLATLVLGLTPSVGKRDRAA